MQKNEVGALFCLSFSLFTSGCQAKEGLNSGNIVNVSSISMNKGEKSFSVGDFNNDGYTDLVVGEEENNRILVFLNDSEGGLKLTGNYPAGSNPTSLKKFDFNRDGKDDIVVANHEAGSVTLLKGNGDGTFQEAEQSPISIETEPHSHMIDVADFNKDGLSDIIVDSRDSFGAFIFYGKKDGRFDEIGQGIDVGGRPYLGFAIGDINNDGASDIITPNQDRGQIGILVNAGDSGPGFSKKNPIQFPSVFSVATGDINGDGNIDLVAANQNAEQSVTLFGGDGQGNFTKLKSFSMTTGAKIIAMGDVNGDGIQDAVVTSWNSDALLITGSSNNPSGTKLPTEDLTNPWSAILGDFDGNGLDEVVIGDATGERVNIYTLKAASD